MCSPQKEVKVKKLTVHLPLCKQYLVLILITLITKSCLNFFSVKYFNAISNMALRAVKAPLRCISHTTMQVVHLAKRYSIWMEKQGKNDRKMVLLISIIREELCQRAVKHLTFWLKKSPELNPYFWISNSNTN